jgi:hypothetical protein
VVSRHSVVRLFPAYGVAPSYLADSIAKLPNGVTVEHPSIPSPEVASYVTQLLRNHDAGVGSCVFGDPSRLQAATVRVVYLPLPFTFLRVSSDFRWLGCRVFPPDRLLLECTEGSPEVLEYRPVCGSGRFRSLVALDARCHLPHVHDCGLLRRAWVPVHCSANAQGSSLRCCHAFLTRSHLVVHVPIPGKGQWNDCVPKVCLLSSICFFSLFANLRHSTGLQLPFSMR